MGALETMGSYETPPLKIDLVEVFKIPYEEAIKELKILKNSGKNLEVSFNLVNVAKLQKPHKTWPSFLVKALTEGSTKDTMYANLKFLSEVLKANDFDLSTIGASFNIPENQNTVESGEDSKKIAEENIDKMFGFAYDLGFRKVGATLIRGNASADSVVKGGMEKRNKLLDEGGNPNYYQRDFTNNVLPRLRDKYPNMDISVTAGAYPEPIGIFRGKKKIEEHTEKQKDRVKNLVEINPEINLTTQFDTGGKKQGRDFAKFIVEMASVLKDGKINPGFTSLTDPDFFVAAINGQAKGALQAGWSEKPKTLLELIGKIITAPESRKLDNVKRLMGLLEKTNLDLLVDRFGASLDTSKEGTGILEKGLGFIGRMRAGGKHNEKAFYQGFHQELGNAVLSGKLDLDKIGAYHLNTGGQPIKNADGEVNEKGLLHTVGVLEKESEEMNNKIQNESEKMKKRIDTVTRIQDEIGVPENKRTISPAIARFL